MKQVIAFVKPFRAEAVLAAIAELSLDALLVSAVKGHGRQKSYLDRYAGSEYATAFLPKVQITAWVQDGHVEEVVRGIIEAARTGRIGDGKILVLPLWNSEGIDF